MIAPILTEEERAWLLGHLAALAEALESRPTDTTLNVQRRHVTAIIRKLRREAPCCSTV